MREKGVVGAGAKIREKGVVGAGAKINKFCSATLHAGSNTYVIIDRKLFFPFWWKLECYMNYSNKMVKFVNFK